MAIDTSSSRENEPGPSGGRKRLPREALELLVTQIDQLCQSDSADEDFYPEFLQHAVAAMSADGGVIWKQEADQPALPAYQLNATEALSGPDQFQQHQSLVQDVIQTGNPCAVTPESNPTGQLLLLVPLAVGSTAGQSEPRWLVEVLQSGDVESTSRDAFVRFLVQICTLVSQRLQRIHYGRFQQKAELWRQQQQLAALIHESLDWRLTAFAIANETHRFVDCDRVSVAICRGKKCRVEAVSGQDVLEKRSNVVTALGRLASLVVATGEPLWYTGETDDLPPQLERALHHYVDETFVKGLAIIPIRKPRPEIESEESQNRPATAGQHDLVDKITGAVIIESIESDLDQPKVARRWELIERHIARAMANSLQYSHLFLMPLWRTLGRSVWLLRGKTRNKTLAVAAILLICLFCLIFVPADFKLKANGVLQPVEREDIFARVEGTVIQLHVDTGDWVTKDQILAQLRNPTLEAEINAAQGELRQAQEKLDKIQAQRLQRQRLTPEQRRQLAQDSLIQEEIVSKLQRNLMILRAQEADLTVRSPLAGQVITWDLEHRLSHRPVTIGQVLLTIAQPNGEWELELMMPEKRMGHIERARDRLSAADQLQVSYQLKSDPGVNRFGHVREIQPVTNLDQEEGQNVKIRVDIDVENSNHPIHEPRPGTSVIAHVHCGRRSIGYCKLHEAFEFVQRQVFAWW